MSILGSCLDPLPKTSRSLHLPCLLVPSPTTPSRGHYIYILYLFNLHPTSSHIPKLSLAYPHYFNKAGHLFDPTDPHPTVPVPPAHLEQVSRTAMRPAWIVPGIRRRSDGRISGGFRVRSGNFQKSPSKRSTYRFFLMFFGDAGSG